MEGMEAIELRLKELNDTLLILSSQLIRIADRLDSWSSDDGNYLDVKTYNI